jgi:hypothetical protein
MPEAQQAYEHALDVARELGETLMIGTTLSNLGEVTNNPETWDEAIRILSEGGHHAAVERMKNNPSYRAVRPRLDPKD